MIRVELYGKPDCCLCDQAKALLERLRAEHPFELIERDITLDEQLHRAYFDLIPVVVVDGERVGELVIEEQPLRRRLAVAAAARTAAGEPRPII